MTGTSTTHRNTHHALCSMLLLLYTCCLSGVNGNSLDSVTITISQNAGTVYVAWSGAFAAWPSNVVNPNEIGPVSRHVFSNNAVFNVFGQVPTSEWDGNANVDSFTANAPALPSFTDNGVTNVGPGSVIGYHSLIPRLYIPSGYTFGTTIKGCMTLSAGRNINEFPTLTNHVAVSWKPAGHNTQQLILNVVKTSQPLCQVDGTTNTGPSLAPTQAPTTLASTASAGGDPHFHTWKGEKYDFHGHCDLVLLDNKYFDNGKGLSIHIRSDPFQTIFSYISRVAVRIGEEIFEVGPLGERHFQNGRPGSIAGFPVHYQPPPRRGMSRVYTILLGNSTRLVIRERQGWQHVSIHGATASQFANSTGLMGSFTDGVWYGRDCTTVFVSVNDYGMEWQVQEELDGLLFQSPSPFPDKCELLTEDDLVQEQRGRRLSESSITHEEAKEACLSWVDENDLDECIFDVLVAEDLDMAELSSSDS